MHDGDPFWIYPEPEAIERPIGLSHLDSEFCWCDPIIVANDQGEQQVIHRPVTWN